jgi:hypothetical protein
LNYTRTPTERGEVAEKDPLVRCPNFGVCQTMVRQSKAGQEHQFGIWDPVNEKMIYVKCSGG